jgi:DNA (cytosine-5)-methyltransferase 1
MKFIDLFAGIGGFNYGIEKAFDIEYAPIGKEPEQEERQQGGKRTTDQRQVQLRSGNRTTALCVYSNEWDKYANSVYRKHFGECDNRDIRTVDAKGLPDFDLLCGGFPCQSFSIAGKRRGFDDTRGTLFFDIARILKEKQPGLCLLENVKGLLSHDNGRTFKTIISTLTELGYDCQWQVLNSKDFGVPQNRERIFIIGHLRGTARPEVFPIGSDSREDDAPNSQNRTPENEIASTLTVDYAKNQHGNQYVAEENIQIRRLTPIECERLQGFPDNWTQYGADGELISDTQRYKMCGNAVTTNVITKIAKRLL